MSSDTLSMFLSGSSTDSVVARLEAEAKLPSSCSPHEQLSDNARIAGRYSAHTCCTSWRSISATRVPVHARGWAAAGVQPKKSTMRADQPANCCPSPRTETRGSTPGRVGRCCAELHRDSAGTSRVPIDEDAAVCAWL